MSEPHANSAASARARLSLEGLSIGDAFGQRFFFPWAMEEAGRDHLPDPPWNYTDDTEMAIAIVQVLEECGEVDQDRLAERFARRFARDPHRGYGAVAVDLLLNVSDGADWRVASRDLFGGSGSFGNGGAMRSAPLGAWFADDDDETIVEQARRSGEVTHVHSEGQAGAVAVALAAAWTWRWDQAERTESPANLMRWTAERLPDSDVRRSVERAAETPLDAWAHDVAAELGCGHQITAMDTVGFCLWSAAAHLSDYEDAMWTTARVGGDIDTNCAIVGGIVALAVGSDGIPPTWVSHREPLAW